MHGISTTLSLKLYLTTKTQQEAPPLVAGIVKKIGHNVLFFLLQKRDFKGTGRKVKAGGGHPAVFCMCVWILGMHVHRAGIGIEGLSEIHERISQKAQKNKLMYDGMEIYDIVQASKDIEQTINRIVSAIQEITG